MSASVEQLRRSHRPTSKDSTKSNLRRGPFRVACRRWWGRSLAAQHKRRYHLLSGNSLQVVEEKIAIAAASSSRDDAYHRRGGKAVTARNWALWFVVH
ncbi:hypothetical protein MUK42_13187 [Musa troglodytarum]|uniref:Uncharacterized protein n=1 Tax=Musa troglodytarum TaxID=320322 RepID=A0A9E7G1Z0_9LILI|nr:hypothetical protein MUK42_13187 [Musa troglodytarum]